MYRFFELMASFLMLILFAPLMLIVALLVYFKMGRPIFFKQQRPGLLAKPFYIYKFRTMHLTDKSAKEELGNTARTTSLGEWLRRLSLDELPQLFNIIKGDVTFVGPRALLMEHLELYTPEQARRHDVKPGVTGWAQINGRNELAWEDKLKLDVWYVEHKSIWLDLQILWKTLFVVLGGKGVEYGKHSTGFNK